MMTSSPQHAACKLAGQLIKSAEQMEDQLCTEDRGGEDKAYQAAMHACFNLGFEVGSVPTCRSIPPCLPFSSLPPSLCHVPSLIPLSFSPTAPTPLSLTHTVHVHVAIPLLSLSLSPPLSPPSIFEMCFDWWVRSWPTRSWEI